MEFLTVEFLLMVGKVILVDVLLGGDNAVVIALASRNLAPKQQKQAVLWGTMGAVGIRVALTVLAVSLLERIPYLKLVGGLLLIWIAVKLLLDDNEGKHEVSDAHSLMAAVKTIIFADLVMSLDNVLALAAVTKGNIPLLFFGLALSIPLIMWGSKLILMLMERYPIIITLGAALLGYTAGEMIVADPHVNQLFQGQWAFLHRGIPVICTLGVVLMGRLLQNERK